MRNTISTLMRFGVGDQATNEILNAICRDVDGLEAHGSTVSSVRTAKDRIRREEFESLSGLKPQGTQFILAS